MLVAGRRLRDQLSYLKDNATRVRYAATRPFSTFTSSFTISATRRSRSVLEAVSTAFLAASSQEVELVPITSVILYTESADLSFLAIMFPFGSACSFHCVVIKSCHPDPLTRRAPKSAAQRAAIAPADPAPITRTSALCEGIIPRC